MRSLRIRSLVVVLATIAMTGALPGSIARAGSGDQSVTIPSGLQLEVNDDGPFDPDARHLIAAIDIDIDDPGEVRRVRFYFPIEHTRVGTEELPDRFYFLAYINCDGVNAPDGVTSHINILAKGTATLTPRLLVTFPSPGMYTCRFRYQIHTSRVYDDSTDDMKTRSGGYAFVSAPLEDWVAQCYWPEPIEPATDGCFEYTEAEAESKKIPFGQSLTRTPTLVEPPHGTTFIAYGDANLTGCGGTGGGESELCGDDLGSFRDSTVRGNLVLTLLNPVAGCEPILSTDPGYDGVAWRDIPVKVHHAILYNTGRWTVPTNPSCPTEYLIEHVLTVTSGESVISHRLSTLLFVS